MESPIYDHFIHILRGHGHRCDLVIWYVIRTIIESLINGNPILFLTDILSRLNYAANLCRNTRQPITDICEITARSSEP